MSRRGRGGSAKAALGPRAADHWGLAVRGDLGRGWTRDGGLLRGGGGANDTRRPIGEEGVAHAWPHLRGAWASRKT